MKKEKALSEKEITMRIVNNFNELKREYNKLKLEHSSACVDNATHNNLLIEYNKLKKDIQNAVERLKESMKYEYDSYDEIIKEIDEIFGDLKWQI